MHIVLGLIGIVGSFFIIKYRERLGDMFGEADWMKNVGGIYNLLIIIGILIFFWSIAEITGTTEILFAPVKWILPGASQSGPQGDPMLQ